MDFDTSTPIYLQILQKIKRNIAAGKIAPGEKLGSVRDLSIEYGVNPNTVQRTMAALESEGLVYAERTSGRFVTDNEALVAGVRRSLIAGEIDAFLQSMQELGLTEKDVIARIVEHGPSKEN